jgi:hypothetical protein
MPTKPKRKHRPNPIADAIDPSDFGAADLDIIMQAARAFPVLRAFEVENQRHIFLATRKPTPREVSEYFSF